MPKVLLVEDDNNLREIFEMRLQAEGYNTVSASDGEEALVIAVKEKPDLVIADVMMPKLSGFEMVENMRAAPELANVKVIMMTALGQAEDRTRGEKLGVVKYLVKSQVTLEDFVRVVREVLPPDGNAPNADTQPKEATTIEPQKNNQESEASMQDDNQTPNNTDPAVPSDPAADAGAPAAGDSAGANPISSAPSTDLASSQPQSTAEEQNDVSSQINDFTNGAAPAAPAADGLPADAGAGASEGLSAPAGAPDVPPSSPPVSEPGTDSNTTPPAADPAAPAAPPADAGAPASNDPSAPNTDTTSTNANAL
jgi:CheY-like chemotaxis protein